MTKYLISVSWPKGCKVDERLESTVEMDAPNPARAMANARAQWPEHEVLAVTEAELQPDGRWTFPADWVGYPRHAKPL
jgi:hypothetical protein